MGKNSRPANFGAWPFSAHAQSPLLPDIWGKRIELYVIAFWLKTCNVKAGEK
jgi:hypothetical protein